MRERPDLNVIRVGMIKARSAIENSLNISTVFDFPDTNAIMAEIVRKEEEAKKSILDKQQDIDYVPDSWKKKVPENSIPILV